MTLTTSTTNAEEILPVGSHPDALEFPHFPDRLHTFVWRNWQLVEPCILADVVGATSDDVKSIATSMGLPEEPIVDPSFRQRGYITLVRRNWHLLPYDQLLLLLDMSAEDLAFALHEDDFLFIKLGSLKPKCQPLTYRMPTSQAIQRAAAIKELVEQHFGEQLSQPAKPRFHFAEKFAKVDPAAQSRQRNHETSQEGVRFVYSYFGMFGDPLSDEAADPFPEGMLAQLADVGVNGLWMHVVLRQLAPGGKDFPEFGEGHEQRLANLRRLVKKTEKYGIRIYLYMNEPRGMPSEFFETRPEMAGISSRELTAMCTSDVRVRQWMTDALAYLFQEVPGLGGVFTITASENVTNCAYGNGHAECPRCKHRTQAEIVAEVNAAIEEGVHRGNPAARVIAWDWGWNGHGDAADTIALLPEGVEFMSVSEWALPIVRGGVESKIGEYSISAVGPGQRAKRHWQLAKERGLKAVAKVQLNNSWELSTVPFLPVLDLVAEHCDNLRDADVDGMMLGWSLGGYPSPNLEVAHQFATSPGTSREQVLNTVAEKRYGKAAAPHVRKAWTAFSQGFREFPYNMDVVYFAPQHMGPANLLYGQPTGYRSTMVGIPYDDVDRWRGVYPADVFAQQFEKVVAKWNEGLAHFEKAVDAATGDQHATAASDLGLAKAALAHFASSANQTRFVMARDARGETANQQLIGKILDSEIKLACDLFALTRNDSRIGFEASNHYFYVPLDLVEKVINCEYLKHRLAP